MVARDRHNSPPLREYIERHEFTRPNEFHTYEVKIIACRYEKTPYQGLVDLELSQGPTP